MKRIYLTETLNENIVLDDGNHHYIKNVLRLTEGTTLEILTPAQLATATIISINKRETCLQINSMRDIVRPIYSFTVCQCLLKREYMDVVVEKYTELGVTKIVPVISERSLGELKESATRRYSQIAISASLQSERETVPEISQAIKIENISVDSLADNILFYEREMNKHAFELTTNNINIVIGAEGGFTSNEVDLLRMKGFSSVSPLNAILKAETAAVVFAGLVRMQLESLS